MVTGIPIIDTEAGSGSVGPLYGIDGVGAGSYTGTDGAGSALSEAAGGTYGVVS